MCRFPWFYTPAVPGALAPVVATEDMTQEVGVRNCRLYTRPGDASVVQFEERLSTAENDIADLKQDDENLSGDVADLEIRVEALEESGGGGTDNNAIRVQKMLSGYMHDSWIGINYNVLPNGAVIDKMVMFVSVSGGTVPRKVEIDHVGNSWYTYAQDGGNGLATWSVSGSPSGGVVAASVNLIGNTLWTTGFATGDTFDEGKIYYHIEN